MRPRRIAASLALALAAMLLPALAAPTAAASEGCASGIGKKMPVLLVHGFNSDIGVWGGKNDNSIASEIGSMSDVHLDKFDYEDNHWNWVTHPKIGRRLAEKIACMAKSSRQEGGLGRVILVSHSMGGLAVRAAGAEVVDGRQVYRDIGLPINMGTPNMGSDLAKMVMDGSLDLAISICKGVVYGWTAPRGMICDAYALGLLIQMKQGNAALSALQSGSDEIKELPWLPDSVPVYAIAGNITPVYAEVFGHKFKGEPTNYDSVVTTYSALRGHKVNGQGGEMEWACEGSAIPVISDAKCSHNEMIKGDFAKRLVVAKIKQWIVDSSPQVVRFRGLNMELLSGWKLRVSESSFLSLTSRRVCSGSGDCVDLSIRTLTSREVAYWSAASDLPLECYSVDNPSIPYLGLFPIGSKNALHYRQSVCYNATSSYMPIATDYWVLPKSRIIVELMYGIEGKAAYGEVKRMLINSTWS